METISPHVADNETLKIYRDFQALADRFLQDEQQSDNANNTDPSILSSESIVSTIESELETHARSH